MRYQLKTLLGSLHDSMHACVSPAKESSPHVVPLGLGIHGGVREIHT